MALADDWSYQLGQAFITAALSCGAVCSRTFVAAGASIEAPPPSADCTCQLAVIVAEGWLPLPKCGARRTATITLVVDLCTSVAAQNTIPDPVKQNTAAQANAAVRWAMMRGLRLAWRRGDLSSVGEDDIGPPVQGLCGRILPGPWRPVRSTGGNGRWEAVWTFQSDE